MDATTQQNAGLVEQAAAASAALEAQAARLRQAVAVFKLRSEEVVEAHDGALAYASEMRAGLPAA